MDRITENLLDNFLKDQEINPVSQDQDFEKFCNYIVVASEYFRSFEILDICTGAGNDTGIDGIGIIVNGSLITAKDEIEELIERNGYLDVTFIFVQSKTSSSFDGTDIGDFCFGVNDFFASRPKLPRNEFITDRAKLADFIFSHSSRMKGGRTPVCKLYYVTTGRWNNQDENLRGRIEQGREDLRNTNLFREVLFEPVDAEQIQKMYYATQKKVSETITFERRVTLPPIEGVSQAYTGVLPASEYLHLLTDERGNIRKALFTDNIRDFLGTNTVNKQIAQTLERPTSSNQFVVLNNGVTLVAESATLTGDRITLENYQIVNGCQTSHVLYNVLSDQPVESQNRVYVPVRIVVTGSDEVVNNIITTTNTQTEAQPEQLVASSPFQKRLEEYYRALSQSSGTRLYYERRTNQYIGMPGIEKSRTIDIRTQIKVFAAMFLDQPYRVGRYYGEIFELVRNKKIFAEDHEPAPYYTSALVYYWLEFFFRNYVLEREYKNFRFHMLLITRYQISGDRLPPFSSKRIDDKYCKAIIEKWSNQSSAEVMANNAIAVLDRLSIDYTDADLVKRREFVDRLINELGN